jgi:glycosyltransferase involved in cell wall biosynthesis
MPIRIALVIARLNIGGPATHVIELAAGLPRGAFEVRLFTGQVGRGERDMHYLAEAMGVVPEVLPEFSPQLGIKDAAALWRLTNIFRDWKPEVVHTHTAKAGALGRVAARMTGVPAIVHTFHGHVLSGYFPPLIEMGFRVIEQSLALVTDQIVTLSPRLKRDLVAMRIAPAEKVSVIPLGMNLEALKVSSARRNELRNEIGVGVDESLIGIVGRLVPIKDHATFLAAAAGMVHSDDRVRFLVVGDGPLRETLVARASEMGLAEKINFLGWRQDMAQVYAALDILALSSRNEGTPVVILEAMAARIPVVATAVGGVSDIVRDRETGWLVPAEDPQALMDAWKIVLADPTETGRITARAQDEVRAQFGSARMIADISDLYTRLVCLKQHG